MLDLQDLYQQRVSTCASNFVKIILTPSELRTIVSIAATIVEAKKNETAHRKDGASEMKRFVNGLKGEYAVAKYLKIPIVDPRAGVSIDFDKPDIPNYNVGIKTVDYGHFPIIPKDNTYPQIICICHPTANEIMYICGLADVDTLNKFQHDDLILDSNLKAKGTKTGFFGFSALQSVTKELLDKYKQEVPIITEEKSTILPLDNPEV